MTDANRLGRRGFIQTSLAATVAVPGMAGVRETAGTSPSVNDKGMPCGRIGDVEVSRLILGSNVMMGAAHSRDLPYIRKLMGRYNTRERVMGVMKTAEAGGINTILQGNVKLVQQYNTETGGNMQQILPLNVGPDDTADAMQRNIDQILGDGARLAYVFGCSGDLLVRDGKIDQINKALELAKAAGVVCGVGSHSLSVVKACEAQQLPVAFYVKTFHHDQYWSATPVQNRKDYCWYAPGGTSTYSGVQLAHNEFHDNIWCLEPEETTSVMMNVKAPFLAYKVLAAGAISPTSGFKFALQNGADFMAVGMLDFQIDEDITIFKGLFARGIDRERPLMG